MMKVCAVSARLEERMVRLQPGCYIVKICQHLAELGVDVRLVSDGYPELPKVDDIEGLKVHRLRHVRSLPLIGSPALERLIRLEDPDVVLWHMGLTSFYHLRLNDRINRPVIGVFTSPIYRLGELLGLRWREMARDFGAVYAHLLGALVPGALVKSFMSAGPLQVMIVQSAKTKEGLVRLGVPRGSVHVVAPGVDEEWLHFHASEELVTEIRREYGFQCSDFLVLYLGSPERYRGVETLVEAVALARERLPALRLQILSRRGGGQFRQEEAQVRRLIRQLDLGHVVQMNSGILARHEVIRFVAASDLVALPFKLVPSGAPISILEAVALRKPVVSTLVDCVPELLQHAPGYLARPSDVRDLARTLAQAASARAKGEAMPTRSAVAVHSWITAALKVREILDGVDQGAVA